MRVMRCNLAGRRPALGAWLSATSAVLALSLGQVGPALAVSVNCADGDGAGWAVAGGGDFDGDGTPDVVGGAPFADDSGVDAGYAEVTSGATGQPLAQFFGAGNADHFGEFVAGGADVNGDGFADVIVGAPDANAAGGVDSGTARVVTLVTQSLRPDVLSLGLGPGGGQTLSLDLGSAFAGATYLVLGSASGTAPGLTVNGVPVPLNLDAYLLGAIELANVPPYSGTLGTLDAAGQAVAGIAIPPATDPGLAGLLLHHAAVTIAFAGPVPHVSAATNAAALLLE